MMSSPRQNQGLNTSGVVVGAGAVAAGDTACLIDVRNKSEVMFMPGKRVRMLFIGNSFTTTYPRC